MLSRYANLAALTGAGALIAALLLRHLWWAPTALDPALGLLLAAPLLTPLPGLLRARPYTHAWASMLVLFYFAIGLTELVSTGSRTLPLPMLCAGAVMFAGCVLFVRLRLRETQA